MSPPTIRSNFQTVILVTAISLSLGLPVQQALSATASELNQDAIRTLQALYAYFPESREISKNAKLALIFPKIIKAGQIAVSGYGEGVMLRDGRSMGYFNSVSAAWDWQPGEETNGYVLFLINNKPLQHLERFKAWEIGTGPTVGVASHGADNSHAIGAQQDDAFAFVLGQHGLLASPSMNGTKISSIYKK